MFRSILFLIIVLICVLSFQNCSRGFELTSSSSIENESSAPADSFGSPETWTPTNGGNNGTDAGIITNIDTPTSTPTFTYTAKQIIGSLGIPLAISPALPVDVYAYKYSVSPPVSDGLNFSSVTGIISGVPAAIGDTTYTVTANTNKGTAVSKVEVNIPSNLAPTISYNTDNFNFYVNNSANIAATITGTKIYRITINPSLPLGLNIDSKGTISGSAAQPSPVQAYTVRAENDYGFNEVKINIGVLSMDITGFGYRITNVSYPAGVSIFYNSPVTAVKPSTTNNPVFTVTPSLPTGLSIDPVINGIIYGKPTTVSAPTIYTVSYIGTDGKKYSTTLNIAVVNTAPFISLTAQQKQFPLGKEAQWTPINLKSGTNVSYSISPPLPKGLKFDASTAEISGKPTEQNPAQQYMITAINEIGIDTKVITLSVGPALPDIAYSATVLALTTGINFEPQGPIQNSGGEVNWYDISPVLPQGLTFNHQTGQITGNPGAEFGAQTFDMIASGPGGYMTTKISIFSSSNLPKIQSVSSPYFNTDRGLYNMNLTAATVSGWDGSSLIKKINFSRSGSLILSSAGSIYSLSSVPNSSLQLVSAYNNNVDQLLGCDSSGNYICAVMKATGTMVTLTTSQTGVIATNPSITTVGNSRNMPTGILDLISTPKVCYITSGGGPVTCDPSWSAATDTSSAPIKITGTEGATKLTYFRSQVCTIAGDGSGSCSNATGGSTTKLSEANLKDLQVATTTICTLTQAGGVQCWGADLPNCLNNTCTYSSPVSVVNLTAGVHTIILTTSRVCALMNSGDVYCSTFDQTTPLAQRYAAAAKLFYPASSEIQSLVTDGTCIYATDTKGGLRTLCPSTAASALYVSH